MKSIKEYYDSNARKEWKRTQKDACHFMEYRTTFLFLDKYLSAPQKLLDAGGGPGRYTVALAQRGHRVSLCDISEKEIELAKRQIKKAKVSKNIDSADVASITDLSLYPSNSFDGVLCLGGPLSHLMTERDRKKAVKELIRVAKPGAFVFISVMNLMATIAGTIRGWPQEIDSPQLWERFWKKGDDYRWCGGSFCHFFTGEELKKTANLPGTKFMHLVGLEGPILNAEREFNKLSANKKRAAGWWKMHQALCTDKYFANMSPHIMIVLQKNKSAR